MGKAERRRKLAEESWKERARHRGWREVTTNAVKHCEREGRRHNKLDK